MSEVESSPVSAPPAASDPPAVSFSPDLLSLELTGDQYRWHNAFKFNRMLSERHNVKCTFVLKESGDHTSTIAFDSLAEKEIAIAALQQAKSEKDGKLYWKIRQGKYKNAEDCKIQEKLRRTQREEENEKRKRKRERKREKKENQNGSGEGGGENENNEVKHEENEENSDNLGDSNDENDVGESSSKIARVSPSVASAVTPYLEFTYNVQLIKKTRFCQNSLRKCLVGLKREFNGYESPFISGKQICFLDPIVGSPILENYRNKSEFSCGLNSENLPTCGFLIGSYREGITTVESADSCPILPPIARLIGQFMTNLMRKYLEFPVYDKELHRGIWRIITIKNTQLNHLLVTVQINPLELNEIQLNSLKQILRSEIFDKYQQFQEEFRLNEKNNENNNSTDTANNETSTSSSTSSFLPRLDEYEFKGLQILYCSGVSNAAPEDSPMELIAGSTNQIFERLFDLNFRLGHHSFFQVNVKSAELLFTKACEWAQCGSNTTLLDICCGTGTIGLTMAKKVKRVIGLEMVEAAIQDAKENAKRNGKYYFHFLIYFLIFLEFFLHENLRKIYSFFLFFIALMTDNNEQVMIS